jgi:4-aminobutyrate aminotransferase
VLHATYGDAASVEELFAGLTAPDDVAAIVVEPILGEGGYIVPPAEFLPGLRAIADRHGILLVFDEVQTGMGRTGKMFAAEHTGVVPDILLVAKGIASGMPLGAMMARREIMTWPPGSHGSTIAGNPVAIAAGMATIGLLEGGLVAASARVGDQLKGLLAEKLGRSPAVTEIRGLGLMIGVELATHELSEAVAQLCFRRGLLVLECGKKAIRLSPPLIITEGQARAATEVFAGAIADARPGAPA